MPVHVYVVCLCVPICVYRYFMNNKHRATVHLKADADEERRIQEEEEKKIAEIRKSLTDGDIKKLEKETKELKALQVQ